jgi:hypothetical protein
MSNMTNPLDGLLELQARIDSGLQMDKCPGNSGLSVFLDKPEGVMRTTYAMMENDTVIAYSVFLKAAPIANLNTFGIGCAVREEHRRKGLGAHVLGSSISLFTDTMILDLSYHDSYFIEATIVGIDNIASLRLAYTFISNHPTKIVDQHSGEDAYHFLRLIELKDFILFKY